MNVPRVQMVNGLHWVRAELELSLVRARAALEQHLEAPDDPQPLQTAAEELQIVRGTLGMIQCFGAATFAHEMNLLLQALRDGTAAQHDESYSALSGATLQLSDYLDLLAHGEADRAVILQPAFNELRAARGQPLLTEAELFAAQAQSEGVTLRLPDSGAARAPGMAQGFAKQELTRFQNAFLQWFRGVGASDALARMGRIAESVANIVVQPGLRTMWLAYSALAGSLRGAGHADSLELKRLFGRAGTQLKLLAEAGEDAAAAQVGDTAYLLVFHTARAARPSESARALLAGFGIADDLPNAARLDELRRHLRGPGSSILNRLYAEIRADFAGIKDGIDLAVRTGGRTPLDVAGTPVRLRRLATTLTALGLPAPQAALINQARVLEAGTPDALTWMEVATAILRVEHSLEEALFRTHGRHGNEVARPYEEIATEIPHAQDLRNSVKALLRESLVDFAQIKSSIDTYLRDGDAAVLADAPRLLHEVSSGLMILDQERAAGFVAELERYIAVGALERLQATHFGHERFADAVACVEVYLEALRDGLPSPAKILDDLAFYIGRLEKPVPVAAPAPAEVVELTLVTEAESEALIARAVAATPVAPPIEEPAAPAAISAPVADDVDPEIRNIFIEEAGEVLDELRRHLPQFRRDPGNRKVLLGVRRAFHTLKGSGRMVGALRIGEFGWAVENMLNRFLEGALPLSTPVFEVVGEAIDLLPGLIENFRGVGSESAAAAALIARASGLAESEKPQPEPDMRVVFCDDARERLGIVRHWLEAQDPRDAEFDLDAEAIRSFHTLKGSAAVVNAVAISRLAAAIESHLNGLRLNGRRLTPASMALLADALRTLYAWVEALAGDTHVDDDASADWQARLEALETPADSAVANAAPSVDSGFAMTALDALQTLEAEARHWSRQPSQTAGAALHDGFIRLAKAAEVVPCEPLSTIPRALAERLAAWRAAAPGDPGSGFFATLLEIIEGLYQQLDLYREGALNPAPPTPAGPGIPAWLTRVQTLPQPSAAGPPIASWAGTEALVAEVESAPAPEIAEHIELASAEEEFLTESVGLDPELTDIFASEADELLEALHHDLGRWLGEPPDDSALGDIRRGLHTLKGSARTAGVDGMGGVAHHLETQLENVFAQPRDSLKRRLAVGMDGLQRQLDGLRRGVLMRAGPVLDAMYAIDAAPVTTLAAPDVPAEVELREPQPVELAPFETQPVEAQLQPEPEPLFDPPPIFAVIAPIAVPAEPPSATDGRYDEAAKQTTEPKPARPASFGSFDIELGDIFSSEATELLESLDLNFEAWQNGDAGAPVRDIQRALHTLKGGARMAGIDAMGDATHELESQVNAVVAAGDFPDVAAFARLRAQLETLQRMHDQIRRGEAQLLVVPPLAADTLARSRPAAAASTQWAPELSWKPEDDSGSFAAKRRETARVSVNVLDKMLNEAGEISIYRSRLEEHNAGLKTQLNEMVQTIARVREQLRMMDIETEAQIAARGLAGGASSPGDDVYGQDFDPLEMDRYSRMQELSRALAESINDLTSLQATMDDSVSGTETLLSQQSRINTEVQQGLMGTLMVPFSRQVQRLLRVVRQTAQENGKQADLHFVGAEAELDRNVLERMTAPLEHLLRNAVVHGIEEPAARLAAGKAVVGVIRVQLKREGAQLVLEISDDGAGLDFAAIRSKAIERGLMAAEAELSDDALARFIFEPGFSTARRLTQDAGRGIGMDVVGSEVKQLGGTLELRSEFGLGTRFLVRLPLTLAVSQALLVGLGGETYAVPLPSIEGIGRIPRAELANYYRDDGPLYTYGARDYRVHYLGDYLDLPRPLDAESRTLTVILVRLGEGLTAQAERRVALVVDQLIGNREIVSKAAGPQISSVAGVAGATILADGRVVLILDVPALIIETARRALLAEVASRVEAKAAEVRETIMVVDDSITMRRVAERLLVRHGYRVVTAKDGLDAIALLQTELPSAVLLDIEMPRADGFEVAAFIRNHQRLSSVPIIMITSRSGEKHRERARSLGVDRYLIKPYQEEQLLVEVNSVRGRLH